MKKKTFRGKEQRQINTHSFIFHINIQFPLQGISLNL